MHHFGNSSFRRAVVACLAPLALLSGVAQGAQPAEAPAEGAGEQVVALVNGEPVSAADFRSYFRAYIGQNYYHGVEPEQRAAIADDAMTALINDRLLLQEAARRGIKGDSEKAKTRLAALKARFAQTPETAAEFEKQSAAIEAELLNDTKLEELQAKIKDAGVLSEATVRAFYAGNPEFFTTPQSNDLSILLFGVPPHGATDEWQAAEAKAGELLARLKAGEAFEALASENSADDSAKHGGRLGPVHEGQIPDNVAAAVNAIAVGGLTDPIRILEGVAIFKVHARTPPSLQPFEAVKERADGLLRRKTEDENWRKFLADLRANAQIEQKQSPADAVRDI
jgi:peptidyl-prolyl cis-trans isomerase SurA